MSQAVVGRVPASTRLYLESLVEQFRSAGSRHPDLTFHYLMTPTPNGHPSWGPAGHVPPIGWSCGIDAYRVTYDGETNYVGILDVPIKRYYESWYTGSGLEVFNALAKEATSLLESLRPSVPLIPALQALYERLPKEILNVPTDDPDKIGELLKTTEPKPVRNPVLIPSKEDCWPRFVLMLGWKGIPTPIERTTWFDNTPHTIVADEFETPIRGGLGYKGLDYERPLIKFRSRMPQVFARSAAALLWVAENSTLPTGPIGEAVATQRPQAVEAEPLPGPATTPRKRRGGRPADTDPKRDARIAQAWSTDEHTSLADLERAFGLKKGEARQALDRHRKREKPDG